MTVPNMTSTILGTLLVAVPVVQQAAVATAAPNSRQQIAVVDFTYRSAAETGSDPGLAVGTQLFEALMANGTYTVIDRSRVAQTLSTLNFGRSLSVDDAIKLGETLGADLVVTGTVTEFSAQQQQCTVSRAVCTPKTTAQVALEANIFETDAGTVTTRRSQIKMTREQQGTPAPEAGSDVAKVALEAAADQAIANLVDGLTGGTDFIEQRRQFIPQNDPESTKL